MKRVVALGAACFLLPLSIASAVEVGVTSAVNPNARSTVGGAARTITLGDKVIHNQRIDTDAGGLVQILLADGTAFTVGPNSSITIDRFVYDPKAGTAQVSASLSKGFMRFIGGKTSKTEGGATINTPIGTAGIRGAVADINLGGNGGRSHVSLVFGDQVTLTRPGQRSQRVFKPGYSIVVDGSSSTVIRTPREFVTQIQGGLTGTTGSTGGSPNQPTSSQVQQSGLPNTNSGVTPNQNVPVSTTPDPQTQIVLQVPIPVPRPTSTGTGATQSSAAVRVLTARAAADDGVPGMVGFSDGADRTGTLKGNAGQTGQATLSDGSSYSLPVYADGAFSANTVTGSLSGTAYVGQAGFRAYMLTDGSNPFYVIAGQSADISSSLTTKAIMSYSLTADALSPFVTGTGVAIPFADGSRLSTLNLADAVSSNLLIAGTPNNSNPDIIGRALQGWLVIDGVGASQKSAIGVTSGTIEQLDGGGYGLIANRGGSDLLDASSEQMTSRGSMTTIPGPAGGGGFFGSSGEHLVIGTGLDEFDNPYEDSNSSDSSKSATVHVGNRTDTVATPGRQLGGRTLTGFASAVIGADGPYEPTVGTISLTFNGDNSTIEGSINDSDGDEIGFIDAYGGATYLDDDRFAAPNANNRSYLVSSKLVPAKIFGTGGSKTSELCDCEFLKWGWWGKGDNEVTTSVHMGNWIIGDVTANVEMPASGSASYVGNAVGSVRDGSAQYIATGAMQATMDFSARTGNVAISDFDGRSFSSGVAFPSSSAFSGTSGATSISGSFANGSDGVAAQGVMGQFAHSDGSWSASGIFGGARMP